MQCTVCKQHRIILESSFNMLYSYTGPNRLPSFQFFASPSFTSCDTVTKAALYMSSTICFVIQTLSMPAMLDFHANHAVLALYRSGHASLSGPLAIHWHIGRSGTLAIYPSIHWHGTLAALARWPSIHPSIGTLAALAHWPSIGTLAIHPSLQCHSIPRSGPKAKATGPMYGLPMPFHSPLWP